MPIRVEEGKTPKGTRCMRTHVSGHVSLADAQLMAAQLLPGQPYHQGLVINIVEKDTEYSSDSRKFFSIMNGNYRRMAVVVTSAILRAAINFMRRLTGTSSDFRMFASEGEAMAWLDEA